MSTPTAQDHHEVIDGIEGLVASRGRQLGPTPWIRITQEQIDRFADATEDHQWIHVDPERARDDGPFGGTIAHGMLTVSLAVGLLPQLIAVDGTGVAINCGLNRVRFPQPVPAGSRVRARATIGRGRSIPGGVQVTIELSMELEAATRPACQADVVLRLLAESP